MQYVSNGLIPKYYDKTFNQVVEICNQAAVSNNVNLKSTCYEVGNRMMATLTGEKNDKIFFCISGVDIARTLIIISFAILAFKLIRPLGREA